MQIIPYNAQADSKQYIGQMVNNLVSEILGQQERQRASRELDAIGQWAGGGFQGRMPPVQTDIGQQMAARLTSMINQPLSPYQQVAAKKLSRIKQAEAQGDFDTVDRLIGASGASLSDQLKYWQTIQNSAAGQYYAPGLEGGATAPKNQKVYDLASQKIEEILGQMQDQGIEPQGQRTDMQQGGQGAGETEAPTGRSVKSDRLSKTIKDTITGANDGFDLVRVDRKGRPVQGHLKGPAVNPDFQYDPKTELPIVIYDQNGKEKGLKLKNGQIFTIGNLLKKNGRTYKYIGGQEWQEQ